MKIMIMIGILIFSSLGAFVPYLWGDTNLFGGWSILFSAFGGFFGIWAGYKVGKHLFS